MSDIVSGEPSLSEDDKVNNDPSPPDPKCCLMELMPKLSEPDSKWRGTPVKLDKGGLQWKRSGNIAHMYCEKIELPPVEDLPVRETKSFKALQKFFDVVRKCDLSTIDEVEAYTLVEQRHLRGRTVEDFRFEDLDMRRIKMHEIDLCDTSTFSSNRIAKEVERKIDALVTPPPDEELVKLVMADLKMNDFPIAGAQGDRPKFLKIAALGYLWLHKEPRQRSLIKASMLAKANDKTWRSVLEDVRKNFRDGRHDPFQQFDRDRIASSTPGILEHPNKDILLVVDAKDRILDFRFVEIMQMLYSPEFVEKLISCIDKWVYHSPIPSPDWTRHPLHSYYWLPKHPEFDIRRAQDPHKAVAGVEHYGCMSQQEDPDAKRGKGLYKSKAITKQFHNRYDMLEDLEHDFFHKALGKFTDAVNSCFRHLDRDLHDEYQETWREVRSHKRMGMNKLMDTKDEDDGWTFRALLANLLTEDHRDSSDWHRGLAAICPTGLFKGGNLVLREIGLQLSFSSGSMTLLAGNQMHHSISEWQGEKRYSVVLTTHESTRRFAQRLIAAKQESAADDGYNTKDEKSPVAEVESANRPPVEGGAATEGTIPVTSDSVVGADMLFSNERSSESFEAAFKWPEPLTGDRCTRMDDWSSDECPLDSSGSDNPMFPLAPYERSFPSGLYNSDDENESVGQLQNKESAEGEARKRKPDTEEAQPERSKKARLTSVSNKS